MPTTIIEYSDAQSPRNHYPARIVSPSRSGPCCFSDMEPLGDPRQEERWVSQYKRCRTCGYTVRLIVHPVPDAALLAELRQTLAVAFQRNVPDY
jgi:hypothetical protein